MAQPTKSELRKEFLKKRDALDPLERKRSSSLIHQRLFKHPRWKSSTTLLCYVSFGSEVETHLLLEEAIRYKKQVVIPMHSGSKEETPLTSLKRFTELGTAYRGILQIRPEFVRPFDPAAIELAILPGIVFDKEGGRIGFGGGYFDRLLPQMPKAFRLALAFSMQVMEASLPMESHDVRMDDIITEKGVLEVRSL